MGMNYFAPDPDHLRALARALESESAASTVPDLPPLPGGPLADFTAALHAAHSGLAQRMSLMRGDLLALADAAVATAHAALTVDGSAAHALDGYLDGWAVAS